MDEERRENSNWDDKTVPLEEEPTVPLRENGDFPNQIRRPKLKHTQSSKAQSPYNQSQRNPSSYGQPQNLQSGGNLQGQSPYQQGGRNPYGNNNAPYQQGGYNSYDNNPYQQSGYNSYGNNNPQQQGGPNPYGNNNPQQQGRYNPYRNNNPQQQGRYNPYGNNNNANQQGGYNSYGNNNNSYQQDNSAPYGQQPYSQREQPRYDQTPYGQPTVKERSKKPVLIAGALVVLLCLGGLAIGLISSGKNGKAGKESTQQSDSAKIQVNDDSFDTVITAKSKDINNIKLFKEPGGTKKAGKVQEGVACALLQEKTVDGEKWAKIDFCNRQGWCRMDRLRTISGDADYFYVKENSENTVFVNERAIKLHTGAGQDTDIAATDVKYGTELSISKVKDGWGRTMYQNKECWIDMNVVGFYASEYWQIERCDGSTTGIKLRKEANEKSEQLTVVPLKTVLQTSEFKNGWAKFTCGGKTGWLKLHYATPCGSASGLSFTEDKTEATTETTTEAKAEVKTAAKSTESTKTRAKAKFGYEISPIEGYCYRPDEKEYMIISNVTDSQFDFEIYNVDGLCFKHHTAVAISDDTAYYDGNQYKLTFYLDEEGIVVDGFDVIGPNAYFTYKEYIDDGE